MHLDVRAWSLVTKMIDVPNATGNNNRLNILQQLGKHFSDLEALHCTLQERSGGGGGGGGDGFLLCLRCVIHSFLKVPRAEGACSGYNSVMLPQLVERLGRANALGHARISLALAHEFNSVPLPYQV